MPRAPGAPLAQHRGRREQQLADPSNAAARRCRALPHGREQRPACRATARGPEHAAARRCCALPRPARATARRPEQRRGPRREQQPARRATPRPARATARGPEHAARGASNSPRVEQRRAHAARSPSTGASNSSHVEQHRGRREQQLADPSTQPGARATAHASSNAGPMPRSPRARATARASSNAEAHGRRTTPGRDDRLMSVRSLLAIRNAFGHGEAPLASDSSRTRATPWPADAARPPWGASNSPRVEQHRGRREQ